GGTAAEFCTDTGTGAPGTAEKGTNGCISNCGMEMVRGNAPVVFRSIAYFEAYSFSSRDCLYQDALQIDGSKYTHLHFAFGTLTEDYQVMFQDDFTSYKFQNFMQIPGPKKILSLGGWDFSINTSTYNLGSAPDHCGDLTIVNQTSDASPSVSDCMQIVNIQNMDGDWEGQGKNGNIDFNVGAQDIVDIITDSVRQFGGSGKVGAMGVLSCDGTVKGQQVEWGLY
ncbi:killer toxin subunits alpha/beta, partial [Aspergillus udagawae]